MIEFQTLKIKFVEHISKENKLKHDDIKYYSSKNTKSIDRNFEEVELKE